MPFTKSQLDEIVNKYHTDGYVIIDGLIPDELYEPLCAAADEVTDKARRREWKDVRMVGKQFPPWVEGDDVWGVQNIMHPDLAQPVFAQWYGSDDLLDVSAALMGVTRDDMQFELFNILVNPLEKDYALSWHRDDIKATATPEEEEEELKIKHYSIQWNVALYDDACLTAIPRSHNRVRTSAERKANLEGGEMPGAQTLALKKGQGVFYNNNIMHVGKYNLAVKRRTLHGCYGCPPPGDTSRARNLLQHGLGYATDPAFKSTLPQSLWPMVDRLNGLQASMEGKEQVYSQDL
ncbi:hypothetical protein CC85DRAFT_289294 [Cutaneotrichosporon oleaginosum]|uniref:Phytanoyl-CoA dioxygenase n=1 Tax=Cutaneotrichosporon oleaginosum TaxID=879819 RepID=A0A0J0XC71_9TREE|nr:uncharacterized protein CC85DRAFT_289294 [Cutaneotrichosporon oleaginosum]KLT38668.1 hypothetical protein CC85DRAFT_289294 [Cutaneotrichosporon oleaginosum]TXT12285.1 hypothetical protein COLE_02695 [Cutaneotrichosporon oleaginosum]